MNICKSPLPSYPVREVTAPQSLTAELLLSALFQFDIYKDRVVVGAPKSRPSVCTSVSSTFGEDEAVYDIVLRVLVVLVVGLVEQAAARRVKIVGERPAVGQQVLVEHSRRPQPGSIIGKYQGFRGRPD